MLDLTVSPVELWFAGAKLGEHTSDVEALRAASLHADSLPLIAESVEYELRRGTMKYIVHRRITGPDAPALGPVLTISSTELTVTLDRPASGPTRIDRYELERYNGSAWVQIASGLSIFGASDEYADSSLVASTAYQYRCRAADTTERASEYSYSTGTTSAGATNQAPAWQSPINLTLQQGSSVSINDPQYVSDPEGDQLTFAKVSSSPSAANIVLVSGPGVLSCTTACPVDVYTLTVSASDGLLSTNGTITLTVTAASTGNNFDITTGTGTFDAAVAGVQPGDTITILRGAGTRGKLKILNLNPVGERVTVRSDLSGMVTIRNPNTDSGGFVLELANCHNVRFTGSTSGVGYGFKIMWSSATTPGQPSAFVQFTGGTDDIEFDHVWVDGGYPDHLNATGIGIQHNDASVSRSGGLFCDGIEIHDCLVENIPHEGMYIGPNWVATGRPLKNVEIHHNIVRNCGWDAIQGKMWWEGTNSVHDNEIEDVGNKASTQAQLCGISVLSGPVSIYNNTVLGTGQQGIQSYTDGGPAYDTAFSGYGPYQVFEASIYNNVVARSGQLMGGRPGVGITVGQASGTVTQRGLVYSNTVVDCNDTSIANSGSASGDFTKNNICAGNTSGGVAANTPTGATQTNNTTSTAPASLFQPGVDNYHLQAETAAVTGTIGTDYSSTDIEGTSRAGTASRGAYEYT